jgi:hypothetical protein
LRRRRDDLPLRVGSDTRATSVFEERRCRLRETFSKERSRRPEGEAAACENDVT